MALRPLYLTRLLGSEILGQLLRLLSSEEFPNLRANLVQFGTLHLRRRIENN